MPKARSKKAKTSHHHQSHSQHQPSQAEIWDDSALIRSWDEAVKEYEFYHSIHARGEDVEEVLRKAEVKEKGAVETGEAGTQEQEDGEVDEYDNDDANEAEDEAEDSEVDEAEIRDETGKHHDVQRIVDGITEQSTPQTSASVLAAAPPLENGTATHHLSSHNETPMTLPSSSAAADQAATTATTNLTLENLKMAYWWAGYYSGLYEGQRQASAPEAQR